MNEWDVSSITNMQNSFKYAINFNQNISFWNTSQVTNMYRVFYGASSFNQNISNWNVNQVTLCSSIFYSCLISESNKPTFTSCTP
jgi:surface protein